jgi:hypothetical protein
MKIFISILILAACFAADTRAGTLIGSQSTITTATTNSATFITNTVNVNLPQVFVANNGLSITNAYYGFFRWSFDNTTFYTNTSPVFIPTVTNAASYTIQAQTVAVPVYIQLLAVTNTANTSVITIGATTP